MGRYAKNTHAYWCDGILNEPVLWRHVRKNLTLPAFDGNHENTIFFKYYRYMHSELTTDTIDMCVLG